MNLHNKTAVIYGAGGSLGGAVAEALAGAGATVFLTGRRLGTVQIVADRIMAAGGTAQAEEVDGFDEAAVNQHLDRVIQKAGRLDMSFNAVGVDVIQNVPLAEMRLEDYVGPVTRTLHTRFLTAKAAARVMIPRRSGVILSLTATPGGIGYPYTGGFAAACSAVENLCRSLGAELGLHGIRVVNIRSGGSPDSSVFRNAIESDPEGMGLILRNMKEDTMLKRLPPMADIAGTAVFLASDMAASITGVTIDVTAGTTAGLNYRARSQTFSGQ